MKSSAPSIKSRARRGPARCRHERHLPSPRLRRPHARLGHVRRGPRRHGHDRCGPDRRGRLLEGGPVELSCGRATGPDLLRTSDRPPDGRSPTGCGCWPLQWRRAPALLAPVVKPEPVDYAPARRPRRRGAVRLEGDNEDCTAASDYVKSLLIVLADWRAPRGGDARRRPGVGPYRSRRVPARPGPDVRRSCSGSSATRAAPRCRPVRPAAGRPAAPAWRGARSPRPAAVT